jgi:two-component system, chemotaxis family, protein-glutamate methylesterase/glutaminase
MTTHSIELIVIGGSAGALEPLMKLLASMPPALSVPIALVIHVLPRQPSLMPTLLSRTSTRRVREPEDKEPLEANTIYVAAPNYHMLVERKRTIALSVDEPVQFSRPSIDVLFESAASAFGARCAGIVLSGSNADGAEGLRAIAAAGGIAIVQAPETTAYDAMPRAATRAVPSARSLAVEDIAPYLVRTCVASEVAS